MPEFKCINCGALREGEKQSICSVCGYKMFETPYARDEILRKEIRDFISNLKVNEISYETFNIYRRIPTKKAAESGEDEGIVVLKREDDRRFPDFEKIRDYVCASSKTEMFHERLDTSIEQIRKHIHTPYSQEYLVSTAALKTETEAKENVLRDAVSKLGISVGLSEIELPELKLRYSETPNNMLIDAADRILNDLILLSAKITKYIKQNNIYGTAYQSKPRTEFNPSDEKDYIRDLNQCSSRLSQVLSKKYVVDIFSDGTEELTEMLKALWTAIKAIMTSPVLVKQYTYVFQDGHVAVDGEIKKELLDLITDRYSQLDEAIYAYDFLADKTDDDLFDLYNKMIELDTFGYMGINKNGLIRIGESEKKLNELIGLSGIKESIKKIKAYAIS